MKTTEDWQMLPKKATQAMLDVLEFGKTQPAHNTYLNLLAIAPNQPAQYDGRDAALNKLLADMVKLHEERGTVLTIHMDALRDHIAAHPALSSDAAQGGTTRDGYEQAAKALHERAQGWHKKGDYTRRDECLQCEAMLNDTKPAAHPANGAQAGDAKLLEQAAQVCDQQADGTNGPYRSGCLACASAIRELRDVAVPQKKEG